MLSLKEVEKHYDGFDLQCSMEVQKGCITGLIGKNGAGKTTAFKAVLGLIRKDGGEITVFGKSVESLDVKDKEHMGVVLSDSGFSGYLSVKDLIPVLDSMYPKFQKDWFLRKCSEYRMPMDKKIKDFSTGMKRKLQLLAAISYGADLLILDEPTSGMDVIARDEMLDLLREYMECGERSILISSHISSDLESLCDDLYMIDDGKIILHEETDELLANYGVLKVTKEQYGQLDRQYILRRRKENYGYSCLTAQKRFYQENYPEIEIGNPVFVISYTPMLCVFVALSTITYDMFDNGAAFLFSLPFSRKDYVREKYIFSGLITLTAWGISVLVAVGYSVVKGEDWKELLMTAGVLLVMAILLMGVSVPLQLKFGAEKSRVVVILVMAVMFGMVIGFFKVMEILNLKPQQILSIFYNMNTLLLALAGIVIFLVLMCISYHTSVRIMQKKEL